MSLLFDGSKNVTLQEYEKKKNEVVVERESMDRLVMKFLEIEGFKEAAECFRSEAKLEKECVEESVADRIEIRQQIQDGDVSGARSRVAELFPAVLQDADLSFQLRLQELIELVKGGEVEAALDYARDRIASEDMPERHLEAMEQALCLLAYDDPALCKYRGLLDPSQRLATASAVNTALLVHNKQDPLTNLHQLQKMMHWLALACANSEENT
eukprot:gene17284-26545_t